MQSNGRMNDKLKRIKKTFLTQARYYLGIFIEGLRTATNDVRLAAVRVEIRIERLPNIPADHYRYINCSSVGIIGSRNWKWKQKHLAFVRIA